MVNGEWKKRPALSRGPLSFQRRTPVTIYLFTIHHSPFTIHGMSNTKSTRPQARGAAKWLVAVAALAVLAASGLAVARAATGKGLEPVTSKRADVERVLGAPVSDRLAQRGTLEFNVTGGSVTVQFVDAKFVAAKKLAPGPR